MVLFGWNLWHPRKVVVVVVGFGQVGDFRSGCCRCLGFVLVVVVVLGL